MAGEQTATNVAAARVVLSGGQEMRLFTATTTATDDYVDVSAYFEDIRFCRAWDTGDGTNAQAYVAGGDYAADDLTFKLNQGAIYIQVIGKSIKSTGGAT